MNEVILEFNTFTNAFDSLHTSNRVLFWEENRKWKWFAISIHHALYMFCTNALHHGNYELLLKNGNHADKKIYIQNGEHFLKSSIEYIKEGHPAYRIVWEKTDKSPPRKPKSDNSNKDDWLINIWSAIARVQDETFWMNRMAYTKSIELTEEEWTALIFFTNKIRNKLTHFIPTTYLLHVEDFRKNGLHVLNIIRKTRLGVKIK